MINYIDDRLEDIKSIIFKTPQIIVKSIQDKVYEVNYPKLLLRSTTKV